jgi:3-hydroxybutyryl-CoA dehydrogenase
MERPNRITVIGAGFMGTVIATLYARYGYDVCLHDAMPSMLDTYDERALPIAASLAGVEQPAESFLKRVRKERDLAAAVEGAALVHEVVQEVLTIKQDLFAMLDSLCPVETILATNTSSFMLTEICHGVKHKQRILGIHYITPAHIIPAIELIYADFTPPALVEWGRDFVRTIDHVGVACRERPGFLINRIQFALLSEIYRIMDEGLASRDDVDAAVRLSLGPRLALWGPLLTEDLVVNKKTALAVTEYLHQQTGDENFAARPVLRGLVDGGRLGAVTGKGWYEFGEAYSKIVTERDSQLKELLLWLNDKKPVAGVGVVS